MLSSIGQNNNVQRFSAVNALRSSFSPVKTKETEVSQEKTPSVTAKAPKGLMEKFDINEIRECAKSVGEFNITEDDIKYGLMYGRSVIAEFLA